MNLKHFFAIAAAAVAFASCSENYEVDNLNGLTVSSSYVSLPVAGGTNTINIKSNYAWQLDTTGTVVKGKSWLEFYPSLTGEAGESQLTISAPADVNGRSAEVLLKSGSQTQHILIIQGLPQATAATCAEVIAGPDAKTFMVTGTVTSIANTTYGNFYLQDNTGTIYIYGTLDKNGNEKNFSSLGIEAGDEVTVTGPKTTYGSTVELVNVTVNKINKSLIKVDSTYVGGKKSTSLPFEGGTANVYLTCKGKGVSVSVPEDAKSWLKLSSIDQNGQSSVVSFEASSNHAGPRSTTLTFNTTDGSKNYTAKVDLAQAGESGTINVPFTVSEAISYIKGLGDATSPSQVYIKGTVSEIAKNGEFGSKFGNGSFFLSEDGTYSGSNDKDFEAFRVLWLGNKKWAEGNAQIAPGAEVVVCATVKSYNGVPETDKGYVYSVNGVMTDANGIGTLAAPFNALGAIEAANAGISSNVYVQGIVSQYANKGEFTEKYGNGSFFISEDGTYHNDKAKDFEAYQVYWLGGKKWTAANGQVAAGDKVVIYGPLTTYNGQAETKGKGAAYIYSLNGATAAKRRR